MASVQESVDVDVPIRVAYDQWTQFESFPQFMGGVERITQLDDTHTHWVTNVDGELGSRFLVDVGTLLADPGAALAF